MFTAAHRGGAGSPLVCLHGFTDTWRTWELVLPALEREHDVLALTLPGHAGGPPFAGPPSADAALAVVEAAMDEAGFATAHLVGNSLGGYLALRLAARGRARSVVAFAPAGGWAAGDASFRDDVAVVQARLQEQARATAPHAGAIVATAEGRRRALSLVCARGEDVPGELIAHVLLGIAACAPVGPMIDAALRDGWPLEPALLTCPLRIVWGTEDRLLPWPVAAARYRAALPHADWVVLDGVGHAPQLDVPLEAAQLVLGLTT